MKVVVPLGHDALARVDKLDLMIVELERGMVNLKRDDLRATQKTVQSLRYKLNQECIDALLNAQGGAPVEGASPEDGYHVQRDRNGRIAAVVWESGATAR